jgi:hypothetical protein
MKEDQNAFTRSLGRVSIEVKLGSGASPELSSGHREGSDVAGRVMK